MDLAELHRYIPKEFLSFEMVKAPQNELIAIFMSFQTLATL